MSGSSLKTSLKSAITIGLMTSALIPSISRAVDYCPDLFISDEIGLIKNTAARGALMLDFRKLIPPGDYNVLIDGETVKREQMTITYSANGTVQLEIKNLMTFENRAIAKKASADGVVSSQQSARLQLLPDNRLMVSTENVATDASGATRTDVSISATLTGDLTGSTRQVMLYTTEMKIFTPSTGADREITTDRHAVEVTIPNPKP